MRARIAWIVTLSSLAAPSFAADEAFLRDAAQGGLAEIALGQLAAAKGSTEEVKAFGRQMVDDHQAANAKLAAAAAKSGVALPTDAGGDARATQQQLQSLSGSAFDTAYTDSQAKAHTKMVELLKNEIANGTDAAAKAWARETLPTVERHVEMIGGLHEKPGEHSLEHALGTPGPADAPSPGIRNIPEERSSGDD